MADAGLNTLFVPIISNKLAVLYWVSAGPAIGQRQSGSVLYSVWQWRHHCQRTENATMLIVCIIVSDTIRGRNIHFIQNITF